MRHDEAVFVVVEEVEDVLQPPFGEVVVDVAEERVGVEAGVAERLLPALRLRAQSILPVSLDVLPH